MGAHSDGHTSADERVHSLPEAREQTRSRLRELGRLIARYARQHFPGTAASPTAAEPPPRMEGMHAAALRYLRWIPFFLMGGFAVSFLWDFPGWTFTIAGYSMPMAGLLRTISVGGLIGFGTNWLAIVMLFRPRKPRPLLGQGLLPAQRERIAYRLSSVITEELVNEHTIARTIQESRILETYRDTTLQVARGVLEDPAFRREVKGLTADYVEHVLRSPAVRNKIIDITLDRIERHSSRGWAGVALKAYRFFREDDLIEEIDHALLRLPDNLDSFIDDVDHLLDRAPELLEKHADDVEQVATKAILSFVRQIDVQQMIVDNIEAYDEQKLERILLTTSNEQLNYIKYLGGVLGCVGGLVIWQPIPALIALSIVGAVLFGADELLNRWSASHCP